MNTIRQMCGLTVKEGKVQSWESSLDLNQSVWWQECVEWGGLGVWSMKMMLIRWSVVWRWIVSNIAIFLLKRDVKLRPTNQPV